MSIADRLGFGAVSVMAIQGAVRDETKIGAAGTAFHAYDGSMRSIAILGGGLSGLSIAHFAKAKRSDVAVSIFEAEPQPGGKIGTESRDGFLVERGPNGIFDAKPHGVALCKQLGLGEKLVAGSDGSRKNRYVFVGEKLHAMPGGPLALLKTPLLSIGGKLSLLAEPLKRKHRFTEDGSDESVAAFARRRFGREAADVFIDALVTGVHAGDPERLSAASAFPRMVGFERESGSVVRGAMRASKTRRAEQLARGETPSPQRMWSFAGGLGTLIDALRDSLVGSLQVGRAAKSLRKVEGKWSVEFDGGGSWTGDAIVLTCPAPQQAELLEATDPALARFVSEIRYASVDVVALGYRDADAPLRPDGFGYIAPQRTRRDLLGVQWCSSIFPGRAPPGFVLWRALCGGANRPDIAAWSEDELKRRVHAELKLSMGVAAEPVFSRAIRWPQAIPQYKVGHAARLTIIDRQAAKHPGLVLGGNAFRGVAINDCIEQGELIADRLLAAFDQGKANAEASSLQGA